MTLPRYVSRDALQSVSYAAQLVIDCDQDHVTEAIDAIDRITLKLARMKDRLLEEQRRVQAASAPADGLRVAERPTLAVPTLGTPRTAHLPD